MDRGGHHTLAPLEQAPGGGVGLVESGAGLGAVVRPERGQSGFGAGLGAQAQYRASAVAGVLLRGSSQTRRAAPGVEGRELLCAVVGMGGEVVGGTSTGAGFGRDDLGPTLCGSGPQRALSRSCHSRGVDGLARRGETRVAAGVVAHAASSARCRAAALLRARLGRSGIVGALVVPAHRPPGLASAVAHQWGRHLSPGPQRSVSAPAQFGPAAWYAVGGSRNGLCRTAPPTQLHPVGTVGRRLCRSLAAADRSGPDSGRGVLVRLAGLDRDLPVATGKNALGSPQVVDYYYYIPEGVGQKGGYSR